METITNRVAEVLEPKGYVKQKVDTDKDYASLFTGESNAYMVMYNSQKKLVALKVCGMDNSAPDNQWKSISTWIFDPEHDTSKEINSISNDFTDFLAGGKPKLANKSRKKNSDDGNADPKFFCKRTLSGVLPLPKILSFRRYTLFLHQVINSLFPSLPLSLIRSMPQEI